VLEHTNNIHKSFEELCRVARKFVVITLPNAYELKTRLKFLLGLPHSGKYGLPVDPQKTVTAGFLFERGKSFRSWYGTKM